MQATSRHGLSDQEVRALETFYRALTDQTPDLLDDVVTPDWDDIPLAPGQGPGPAGLKAIIRDFVKAFPDVRIVVEDVFGGHGRAGVRAKITGTQRGDFFGIPATNRTIAIAIHEFHELTEGRMRRTWHREDWFSMLNQLGAWPLARPLHPESA